MTLITDHAHIPAGSVLALGNFDGVHMAHKAIFAAAKDLADKRGVPFGVYTFSVNTKKALGVCGVECLTTVKERAELIASCGADFLYEEDFDAVRALSPKEFCVYLSDTLHVGCVVCGEDFRFGRHASGDASMLQANIPCVVVPTLYHDGRAVSATWIRELIRVGDVEAANMLLGYRFFIEAKIVHGQSLGHTLGFPTINQMSSIEKIMPKRGVYASVIRFDGQVYHGVTNVGVRPTVMGEESENVVFETNILDFDGDLYGRTARVEFCSYMRSEKRFEGVGALQKQVMADIEAAKRYFENEESQA